MIEMIKNEFIKLFKRKRIYHFQIILMIFAIVILMLFYFFSGTHAVNKDKSVFDQLNKKIELLSDNDEKKSLIDKRDKITEDIDYHYNLSDPSFDWQSHLMNINDDLQHQKDATDDDNLKSVISTRIDMNNYLIENNIKPDSKYSVYNYDLLMKTIMILGTSFIFILIALTICDIVSSEYSNDTIQLIFLRPISTTKYIFSKVIASIIFITLSVLIFYIFIFIVGGLLCGFGNPSSPVYINPYFNHSDIVNSYYNQYITSVPNTTSFLPIWQVTAYSIILQILFISCCVLYCVFLSTLFKKTITSLTISILTPLIAYITSNLLTQGFVSRISALFFPFLSNTPAIITRDYIISTGNEFIHFGSTSLIFMIWMIILSLFIFLISRNLKYK